MQHLVNLPFCSLTGNFISKLVPCNCTLVWDLDKFPKSDIIWLQEILEDLEIIRGDRVNNRIDE